MRMLAPLRVGLFVAMASGLLASALGQTVIRIAASAPVSTLDPIKSAASGDIEVLGQLYSRLLRASPDGSELLPGLAESWEVSDDSLRYTFHLREAQFSDGSPITADDVVFSFLRLRDQEDSAYGGAFQVIEEIEALDDRTVLFTLETPTAPFMGSVEMFNAGIVSKRAVEEMGDDEFGQNPVSSGPFRLKQWLPNDRLVLERNPHYWREGQPYIDEVEFVQVADENTRVAMIQAGEVDVITGTPLSAVDNLKSQEGIDVPLHPSSVINILLLNHSRPPFDDVRVRQAVALGVDVESLVKAVTFGYGVRANSTLPNALDYYHEDLPAFPYEPERARSLVEEAGAEGSTVEFMITSGSSSSTQIAQLVQAQLGAIGLNVRIATVDTSTWWNKVVGADYGLTATWWYNETTDPDQAVRWALCGGCGNESFYSFYRSSEIDRLTEEGVQELDPDKRRAIYHQIQEIAQNEVAQVPLYYQPYLHAYSERVQGLMMSPALQWSLDEATVND
jgi:peptide/nickel transport system substrate-binding protein